MAASGVFTPWLIAACPIIMACLSTHFALAGVATSRPETAQAAAAEIGCPIWTEDFRGLFARDDMDVVDVCVPNNNTRRSSKRRRRRVSTVTMKSRWR